MIAAVAHWTVGGMAGVTPRVASSVVWSLGKLQVPAPALVEGALDLLAGCLEEDAAAGAAAGGGGGWFRENRVSIPEEGRGRTRALFTQPPPAASDGGGDGRRPTLGGQAPAEAVAREAGAAAVRNAAELAPPAASASASGVSAVSEPPSLLQQMLSPNWSGSIDWEECEGSHGHHLPICPPAAEGEPVLIPEEQLIALQQGQRRQEQQQQQQQPEVGHVGRGTSSSSGMAGKRLQGEMTSSSEKARELGAVSTSCSSSNSTTTNSSSSRSRVSAGGGSSTIDQVYRPLLRCRPSDVAQALWGSGRLGHRNSGFLAAACACLPGMVGGWSDAELVGGLWGLGALRYTPGERGMEAIAEQVRGGKGGGTGAGWVGGSGPREGETRRDGGEPWRGREGGVGDGRGWEGREAGGEGRGGGEEDR